MRVEQIREKQKEGYAWALSGQKAILRKDGKQIIARNINDEFRKIALLGSIDAFCFGIFGPNGKDRWQYQQFTKIINS